MIKNIYFILILIGSPTFMHSQENDSLSVSNQISDIDTSKIFLIKKTLFYKGIKQSNDQLLELIYEYPYAETRKKMKMDFMLMKKYRRNRMIWTGLGIYFCVTPIMPVWIISTTSKDSGSAWQMALPFIPTICLAGGLMALTNHKYIAKKKKIVATYNQFQ